MLLIASFPSIFLLYFAPCLPLFIPRSVVLLNDAAILRNSATIAGTCYSSALLFPSLPFRCNFGRYLVECAEEEEEIQSNDN